MVKPFLDQVNGRVTDDVNLFTGGLNTYVDKAFIEANQLPFCMNMTMQQPPCLETRAFRLSMAHYYEDEHYDFDGYRVLNMYANAELFEGLFFIVDVEGKAHLLYMDTILKQTTDFGELGDSDIEYYFCHCWQSTANYIYVTSLHSKYKIKWADNEMVGEQVADDFYGIPEFHKGRLFLANPETKIVTFSALYNFDNFDQTQTTYQLVTELPDEEHAVLTTLYLMDYDTDNYTAYEYRGQGTWRILSDKIPKTDVTIDGTTGYTLPDYSVIAGDFNVTNAVGPIIGMKSFDDKLYIFCQGSIHLLYGSTPDTSLSNFFQLVDLNNGIGAYSNRCIAVGGNRLFFLGSDRQVYEHTGSTLYMISRPTTEHGGGIDNLIVNKYIGTAPQMTAGNSKLFFNVSLNGGESNDVLFVYDIYNKIWWAEDGEFTSVATDVSNAGYDVVFMARQNGDIVYVSNAGIPNSENDEYYNFTTGKIETVPIKYQFQTRVYGIDGVDMRKTISDVWVQAKATAEVYVGDMWTIDSHWDRLPWNDNHLTNYIKIGEINWQAEDSNDDRYTTDTSEQQRCIVPKMFSQRVNGFSVLVTGEGKSKFYLMKRNWRVS